MRDLKDWTAAGQVSAGIEYCGIMLLCWFVLASKYTVECPDSEFLHKKNLKLGPTEYYFVLWTNIGHTAGWIVC